MNINPNLRLSGALHTYMWHVSTLTVKPAPIEINFNHRIDKVYLTIFWSKIDKILIQNTHHDLSLNKAENKSTEYLKFIIVGVTIV